MKRAAKIFLAAAFSVFFLATAANAQDSASGDRSRDILRKMSLEEKAGQVLTGFFRGGEMSPSLRAILKTVRPGGVILYASTGNISGLEQVAGLVSSIQEAAATDGTLPLLVAVDQEGGRVNRLTKGVTVFPGNMALGATGDEKLAAKAARITSRELRTLGITANFAPVADIQSNPANPVIGTRSFGADPALVARFASAMILPMAEEGVLCTAKHFPGHGDTALDSHFALPADNHPREFLDRVNLAPFRAMVQKGVPAVMTAHVSMPALDDGNPLPATLLPKAYSILREEMNFRGLAVTDSLGMKALSLYWSVGEAAVRALQAGADMLVLGADPGHEPAEIALVHNAIVEAARTDRIARARLDEAAGRVIRAKESLGVLDDALPRGEAMRDLGSAENLAVADEIARRALTVAWSRLEPFPAASPEKPRVLLWPLEKADQAWIILKSCPSLKPQFVPLSANPEDMEGIAAGLDGEEPVFVWAGDLAQFPSWRDFARSLGGRSVLLGTGSPYGLSLCPEAGAAILTYSEVGVSLKALGQFMAHPWPPTGRLPVEIPGVQPQGAGLSRVP